jgi:hypothetical protein
MFAARNTLPHSSAISLPKSPGESSSGVPPKSASRLLWIIVTNNRKPSSKVAPNRGPLLLLALAKDRESIFRVRLFLLLLWLQQRLARRVTAVTLVAYALLGERLTRREATIAFIDHAFCRSWDRGGDTNTIAPRPVNSVAGMINDFIFRASQLRRWLTGWTPEAS